MINYIEKEIKEKLKLTKDYKYCKISTVADLEGVLDNERRNKDFFVVLEGGTGYLHTENDKVIENYGLSILIISKWDNKNMDYRSEIVNKSKLIYKKIVSKLLYEKENENKDFLFLNEKIPFSILSFSNFAGILFTITNDTSQNLKYNRDDWN